MQDLKIQNLRRRAKNQGLMIRTKRNKDGEKSYQLLKPSKNDLKVGDLIARDLSLDELDKYLSNGGNDYTPYK